MANRHMKRCSTSASMREMQIKTTVRFIPSIRMAVIKKTRDAGKDVVKKRTLIHCLNVNWSSHCGKQYGIASKKIKIDLP